MHLEFAIEPHDTLVVHLRDGDLDASAAARPSKAAAESLLRAVDAAIAHDYGECFWPGATGGQYWWIFKKNGDLIETIAMWTRGGASLWEHVFRATDGAVWLHDRITDEVARIATS